ncbi:MAG: NAD(P)/FAD-dependent oxidoreductase [Myxococcota bacterium]
MTPIQDVFIVGGGPAGLSAALALGIARKRVLLCDAGQRRNAAAERIHNLVTRDGTPPDEFRAVGRDQLRTYPSVEVRDARVGSIAGARGAFEVTLESGEAVTARRILLATGMIDEPLPIDGFRALWGRSIFQCPYCHGWEVQDRPWGYLAGAAEAPMATMFALQARGWTRELTVFTNGGVELPEGDLVTLATAGIRLETAPIARLVARDAALAGVELTTGITVACAALFAHPPQRQVDVVRALGVELDEHGYVRVDPARLETSVPGVYAAGDLANRRQAAIFAAAAGTQAATMLNLELTCERVLAGAL